MRFIRTGLALLLVLMLIVGCTAQQPAASSAPAPSAPASSAPETVAPAASGGSDGVFRLGVLLPTTGSFAATGTECSNGAWIAINEINANGGINGMQIEVIQEDTGADNTAAINAANKVLASDVDFILGPPISTQCSAMTPMIVQNQVPALYRGVSTDLALGEGWIYRCCAPDWVETEGVTRFAVEEMGFSKIAIIHSNDEFGLNAAQKAQDSLLENYNITPITVETFNTTDTDVTAQLLNIKNANPEVVFQFASGEGGVYALRQRLNVGFTTDFPWVGTGNLYDPGTLSLLNNEDCENVYVLMNSIFIGNSEERAVKFAENFRNEYDYDSGQNGAIYYDAVYMIKEACENANGSTVNTDLLEGMKSISGLQGIAANYTTQEDYETAYIASMVQFKSKQPVLSTVMEW